jgi:hypothetical protein
MSAAWDGRQGYCRGCFHDYQAERAHALRYRRTLPDAEQWRLTHALEPPPTVDELIEQWLSLINRSFP